MEGHNKDNVGRVLVLAFGLAVLAANLQAATFNFAYTGTLDAGPFEELNYTVDGIGLTITAHRIRGDNGSGTFTGSTQYLDPYGIYHDRRGLGVQNSANDSSTTIDGRGWHDALLFSFSEQVKFDSLSLAAYNGVNGSGAPLGSLWWRDDYNFAYGTEAMPLNGDFSFLPGLTTVVSDGQELTLVALSGAGNQFLIWADDWSDNFLVSGLSVSAVPLPATLWMFGPALVGFVMLSNRRGKS